MAIVLNLPRETAVRMHERCATTGEWIAVYYDPKLDKQFICMTTTGEGRIQALYYVGSDKQPFAELLPLEWFAQVADDEEICTMKIRLPECTVEFVNYVM